jgi:hypothetical protein
LFPLLFGGKNIGVRKKVCHFSRHTVVHTWNALVIYVCSYDASVIS